jgi:hypothetical protein
VSTQILTGWLRGVPSRKPTILALVAAQPRSPEGRGERLRAALDRPLAVLAFVAVVWGVWAVAVIGRGHVDDLPRVGLTFLDKGAGASDEIDALRPDATRRFGYDGQFFLYIAIDPLDARHYVDEPPYRYARIVYPLLARVTAAGQPDAVPWTLFGLGLLAVGAGTYLLARFLAGRGASPWYALLFALTPGLQVAVNRDLSESLAYALVAAGILAFDRLPARIVLAGGIFALAGITRETTLLFPLAYAPCIAFGLAEADRERRRNWPAAALFAVAAIVPYLLLRLALWAWLGVFDTERAPRLEPIPFRGILQNWPLDRVELEQIYGVVVPSLLALAAVAVLVRRIGPAVVALGANVLGLVILLPEPSYAEIVASSRIALGVVVAFVACLPFVPRADRILVASMPAILWFAPWYSLFPTAFGR